MAALVLAACTAGATIAGAAIDVPFGRAEMTRALALSRWPASDADRARFHARYIFEFPPIRREPITVERIEVTTEFRRLELIAEEHARLNDLFGRAGLRDAEEAMARWRGQVWVTAHLGFPIVHPFWPAAPEVDVRLGGQPSEGARDTRRALVYGNCPGDSFGCSVTGATIEAGFDAAPLAHATRPVIVLWNQRALAQVTINFGDLE